MIGLAVAANHLHFANQSLIDQPFGVQFVGVGAAVRNCQLCVMPFAGREHGVGFGQRAGKRLFAEDALDAGFGAGDDHVMVLVNPTRTDADEVRLDGREHLAVVGVTLGRLCPLCGCRPPFCVRVGDGDDLDAGQALERQVKLVAVVAAPGVADDGGAVGLGHRGLRGGGRLYCLSGVLARVFAFLSTGHSLRSPIRRWCGSRHRRDPERVGGELGRRSCERCGWR